MKTLNNMRTKAKQFTEQEALAYFASVLPESKVLSTEWGTFRVDAMEVWQEPVGIDAYEHEEYCFDITFALERGGSSMFSVWYDINRIYGEW